MLHWCKISTVGLLFFVVNLHSQNNPHWGIHDMNRPKPPIVDPGTPSTQNQPGIPPADAVVLFAGSDLSAWCNMRGEKATWKVKDGYLETVGGSGTIRTWQAFGDCQLHIEWSTPTPPAGKRQFRDFSDGKI